MHPICIRIGDGGLPTYGVAMAAGFLAAVLLGVRTARRQGVSVERVLDLSFWLLAASLLGSRLTFVALHASKYLRLCTDGAPDRSGWQALIDCTRALHIWEGGYVFFGGFLLSTAVTVWYTVRHRMSFPRLADLILPPLALGHFFGRLGCFAAGCCYGKPTPWAVGVAFPRGSLAHLELVRDGRLAPTALVTMPLHPTQLYEALLELGVFVVLTLRNARKRYHGQLLVTYLALYPAGRLLIELFRGDPDRGHLLRLSTPTLNGWLGLPPGDSILLTLTQCAALCGLALAPALHRVYRAHTPGEKNDQCTS